MKNAIVALVRGYNDVNRYNDLIKRNLSIESIIKGNTEFNFDFILAHEGNISTDHQEYIQSHLNFIKIMFIDVTQYGPKTAFDPKKNTINNFCKPNWLSNRFPLGYKHMCHFWSIDFLNYFKEYKFIIRVDEDCVVDTFDLEILKDMEENNIYFSTPMFQGQDERLVIDGLEQLRNKFCESYQIEITKNFNDLKCPYTNFMIVDVENINKNKIIKNFLNEIDTNGCIYSNRWGDLPIWGVILNTFLDKKHYKEIKNIKYYHGSHNIKINY